MADEIPVLDLAPLLRGTPGALDELGAQLRRAFTEVGFYFVRNTGVPQPLVN
jgi:isopenicillin N synthase-like dioxygenase